MIQFYGFFCVWMHRKWVMSEMPQLMREYPPMTFLRLMFPCAYSIADASGTSTAVAATVASSTTPETTETGVGAGAGAVAMIVDPRSLEEGATNVTTTTTTTTESR